MMADDIRFLLGSLKSQVEAIHESQNRVEDKLDGIDGRLRTVERRSAVHGAASGAVTSGFVSLGVQFIKEALTKGGV